MLKQFLRFLCAVPVALILFTTHSFADDQTKETKKTIEENPLATITSSVLLPPGAVVIDPSLQYSNYSRHRMAISGFTLYDAIIIGELSVSDVKRDILLAAVTTRFGILPGLEGELKIPYLYRHDYEVKGAGTSDANTTTVDDDGLGDIEGALAYHLIRATDSVPDIIYNIRIKSLTGRSPYKLQTDSSGKYTGLPTGNGHWGISSGFTALKTSDPAIFIASLSYYWNIKRDAGVGYGTVDPGDSIEYGLGVAYALNEKLSLSTMYQQRFTFETKQNDKPVDGTLMNSATLSFGASYAVTKKSSVNFTLGVGLTVDAPDVQLTVSMPFQL